MLPSFKADSLLKVSGITRDNVELARYLDTIILSKRLSLSYILCKVTKAGRVTFSANTRRVSECTTRASGGRRDTRRPSSGTESGEGRVSGTIMSVSN